MKKLILSLCLLLSQLVVVGQSYRSYELNNLLQKAEFSFCSNQIQTADSIFTRIFEYGYFLNSYDLHNAALASTAIGNRSLFYAAAYQLGSNGVGSEFFTESQRFKFWQLDSCWQDLISSSRKYKESNFTHNKNWQKLNELLNQADSLRSDLILNKLGPANFNRPKNRILKEALVGLKKYNYFSDDFGGANIINDTLILNYPRSFRLIELSCHYIKVDGSVNFDRNNIFDSIIRNSYFNNKLDISTLSPISIFSHDSAVQLPRVFSNGEDIHLKNVNGFRTYFLAIENPNLTLMEYMNFLECYRVLNKIDKLKCNYRTQLIIKPKPNATK